MLTFFPESKNTGRIDRADQRHIEDDPKDFRSRAISKTLIGLSPIRLLLTSGNHYDAVVPVGKNRLNIVNGEMENILMKRMHNFFSNYIILS